MVRPHLLAFGALAPDEVISNPKNYVGKEVSVVGYYYPASGVFDFDGWVCSINILEADLADLMDLLSGKQLLAVELPPGEDADTSEKYVFTGVVKMEHGKCSRVLSPYEELPKIVVSSLVKL